MAGKISDHELRLRALRLTNAYEQPGVLLRPLAEGDRLVEVINIYEHEHWPNEKVYCSQCNGHHHRKGFTALVMAADGSLIRMLLGSTCGGDAFGETWQISKRRMEAQHDRQWELNRLDRLETIANEMKSHLEAWAGNVRRVVGRKSAFVMKLPELASKLAEAQSKHNGFLYVHRQVRLNDGSIIVDTQLLDRLRGADIFEPLDMSYAVGRAAATLDAMAQAIGRSDGVPTGLLRKRRREFEATFDDLHVVAVMYAGAQDFFTASAFAKIVDWTKRYAVTERRYGWNGKSIENKDGWNEFELPGSFPDLDDAPLDLITEYRRAD